MRIRMKSVHTACLAPCRCCFAFACWVKQSRNKWGMELLHWCIKTSHCYMLPRYFLLRQFKNNMSLVQLPASHLQLLFRHMTNERERGETRWREAAAHGTLLPNTRWCSLQKPSSCRLYMLILAALSGWRQRGLTSDNLHSSSCIRYLQNSWEKPDPTRCQLIPLMEFSLQGMLITFNQHLAC